MKVIGGKMPPARTLALFKGQIQFYGTRGGVLVVQKWPRKRGSNGTPAQMAARADFKQAISLIKSPCEQDWRAANALAQGTAFMPRDLLMMAAYGTLVSANFADGTTLMGVRIVTLNAQQLLNTISTNPGDLLVRSATAWISIPAGAAGDVLTSAGVGNIPTYAPASGGTGGSDWEAPFDKPDASEFPTTFLDLGGALVDGVNGEAMTALPSNNSGDHWQYALQPVLPIGTTGWEVVARFEWNIPRNDFLLLGIVWKKSTADKLSALAFGHAVNYFGQVNYNSPTSYNSQTILPNVGTSGCWLRLRFDGTNLIGAYSEDGYDFVDCYSESVSGNFVGMPDLVGWGWNVSSSNMKAIMRTQFIGPKCLSWTARQY